MINKIKHSIKFLLIVVWAIIGNAQSNDINPIDSLPLDPAIRYGRLDNGFTYYVKSLPNTEKVEMNLWVKAGIFNQSVNQKSVAHLIEHLPFRSTKHFPGSNIKLSPLIKKHGIKDFAGRTIRIHTEYQLKVPSSSGIEGLSTGLLWFKDIGDLEISSYDVKKETGILRQEAIYRSGDLMEWILLNKKRESLVYPCTPDLSTFFTDIENITSTEVAGFYNKWYRPDRMGLAIIGNIKNIAILEGKIKSYFSNIPVPASPNPKCNCNEKYIQQESKFAIVERIPAGWIKNDDLPVEVFLDFRKQDPYLKQEYSKKAFQTSLVWDALGRLIDRRFIAKNINSSFVNQKKREKPFLQIGFNESNGTEKQKIQDIVKLLHQVQVFGFTAEEWSIVQGNIIEEYLNKTDTTSVDYWNTQIKSHFVNGVVLPENKSKIIQRILKSITLEHINEYIKTQFSASPDDISMLVPIDNKALLYTESEVRRWIQEALEYPISPFTGSVQLHKKDVKEENVPLLTEKEIDALSMLGITNMGIDPNTGVEVLKLDNGIRVLLDRKDLTTNAKGSIKIHGLTRKGANCYSLRDYFSAINAPDLIQANALRDNARVYVNNLTSGIITGGDIKNKEKIFQQIYLCFTSPLRPTKNIYKQWKKQAEKQYFYPAYDLTGSDFMNISKAFLGDKSFIPKGTMRFYGIEKTKPKRAYNIYKDIFGNASNFTFIVSGNYSKDQIMPLLQKYIGNLPVRANKLVSENIICNKDAEVSLPSAPLYKEFYAEDMQPVYAMRSVNYELSYMMKNIEDFWDWKERVKLIALSKFIRPRLDQLRYEKRAGLYGINYSYTKFNRSLQTFKIAIYLACKENELNWLRQECQEIIMDIKENGIDQNEFYEISKSNLYPYFVAKPNQKPTSNEIFEYYRYGTPIINKEERENFVRSLTPDDIQETAAKYFTKENMYEFVMKDSKSERKPH